MNGLHNVLSELIQKVMSPLGKAHVFLDQSQILNLQVFKVFSRRNGLLPLVNYTHEVVFINMGNVSGMPFEEFGRLLGSNVFVCWLRGRVLDGTGWP